MSIESDLIAVLRNQYTRRISFSFDRIPMSNQRGISLTVNSSTFERVAALIENEALKVRPVSRRGELITLPDGSIVRFRGRFDYPYLDVPLPVGRQEQASLIHESVHASVFLTGAGNSTELIDNEAAAEIAQHLYMIYTNFPHERIVSRSILTREMRMLAHRCARQIVGRGSVNQSTVERLRRTIGSHRVYR